MADPVKIGIINESINMLDHFVALDSGLYKDEGLEVELVVQQVRGSLKLLETGNVLVSSSTPRVIEAILLDHMPYKFVLLTRRDPPHYIVSRPDIKTARDLRGKILWGSGVGVTNYYMMVDWLRKNGLEPGSDVKLRSYNERPESFFQGVAPAWVRPLLKLTCDAMMVVPPEWEWLVQQEGYNTLVELTDERPNRMIHGLAVHENHLEKQADLIRRVVGAHLRSAKIIQEDREATLQVLMGRWDLNRRVAEGCWENMRNRFMAEIDPSLLDLELAYFKEHLERLYPGRDIDTPDPAVLIEPSFVS